MDNTQRVKVLSEALPYIQRFRDRIIVVKYGGSAMLNDDLKKTFARDVALLKEVGMHPVIVHGGGPSISKNLDAAGISSRFVQGLRVTDAAAMEVVEKTLAHINQDIVAEINTHGGNAVSVTDYMIKAKRLAPLEENGETVDLGYVGQVVGVADALAEIASDATAVPVISPVGKDLDGAAYNINGDLSASSVAVSLSAEKLIMLTDTQGVLDHDGNLISLMNSAEVVENINTGVISGGMLPKVKCAFEAVHQTVASAHIIDGRVEHALLLELLTDQGVGTLIHSSSRG